MTTHDLPRLSTAVRVPLGLRILDGTILRVLRLGIGPIITVAVGLRTAEPIATTHPRGSVEAVS